VVPRPRFAMLAVRPDGTRLGRTAGAADRAGSDRPRHGYRQRVDRRFLRPGWIAGHLLVVLAVLVCLRLGWWQWGRTHDSDGTAQNLGYALLWPAFGAAFIYMWLRFLQLEVIKDAEDQVPEMEKIRGPDPAADDWLAWPDDPELPSHGESGGATGDFGASDDGSKVAGGSGDDGPDGVQGDQIAPVPEQRRGRQRPPQRPSQGITIAVATVGDDDADDPELTAYNQALAALAEEDRRRAR
jgi:hypothetical protein